MKPLSVAVLLGIALRRELWGFATMVGTPTNPVLRVTLRRSSCRKVTHRSRRPLDDAGCADEPAEAHRRRKPMDPQTGGLPRSREGRGATFFRDRLRELGRMQAGERNVLIVFVSTAALWVLAQPLALGPIVIPSAPQLLEAGLQGLGLRG